MKIEVANSMTVADLCEYAVKKMVAQGKQCTIKVDPDDGTTNVCVYGDGQGNHCALGWLLDEENEALMNYRGGVHALWQDMPEFVPTPVAENKDLFATLQNLHDTGDMKYLKELREAHRVLVDVEEADTWVEITPKGEGNED